MALLESGSGCTLRAQSSQAAVGELLDHDLIAKLDPTDLTTALSGQSVIREYHRFSPPSPALPPSGEMRMITATVYQ